MNRKLLLCYEALASVLDYRPCMSSEQLTLWVTFLFTILYNIAFWQSALAGYELNEVGSWSMAISMFAVMTSLQFIVFVPFVFRWSTKIILTLMLFVASCVSYFTSHYGTYFDTTMLDNVLQTDVKEARELFTTGLLLHMLIFFALPAVIIWQVRLEKASWSKAIFRRLAYFLGGVTVLLVSVMFSYQGLSSLMRNHKELRYLVTPGNYLISLSQVLASDTLSANAPRLPVGSDAMIVAGEGKKPMLLVIVVGETVRAANWGLNGYERQTTPELAQQQSIFNFPSVTSCGTSTAVSLPCMFSLPGHDAYEKAYAREHESLLDLLKHAGLKVFWLDNQSGCKGVCDGVMSLTLAAEDYPELCEGGRCLDEALVEALKAQIEKQHPDDTVIVLHQLGNHGPSYYQRYPAAYERFTPTCTTSDLSQCSQEEITNSYDNAILYTDHILNQVIETLSSQSAYAASMIYLSDHGESLGEKGLYLHGIPYAIAPNEQTQVPMLWWLSSDFAQRQGINTACLAQIANRPASHDNLFHSVLGLLNISTEVYREELDISRQCSGRLHEILSSRSSPST